MIQKFVSSFTDDLAKPSRFEVKINPPSVLRSAISSSTLAFRCENASLPGRTLSTSDLRIYGPTEKYPYQSAYDDITLTFIVTSSMIEKTLFNTWMDYINNPETWNFEYKSNYVTDILISQFDTSNRETHEVKLVDAFPISINELDLDWGNDAAYHKLSVVFAYTYWEITKTATPSQYTAPIKNTTGFGLGSLLQIGALAASSGQALKSGNPYALLGVAGAASSIIPSIGGTRTVSSLLNSSGRGVLDTNMDKNASIVNTNKFTISGLTSTSNKFKL
jgi:hypothetical protein